MAWIWIFCSQISCYCIMYGHCVCLLFTWEYENVAFSLTSRLRWFLAYRSLAVVLLLSQAPSGHKHCIEGVRFLLTFFWVKYSIAMTSHESSAKCFALDGLTGARMQYLNLLILTNAQPTFFSRSFVIIFSDANRNYFSLFVKKFSSAHRWFFVLCIHVVIGLVYIMIVFDKLC